MSFNYQYIKLWEIRPNQDKHNIEPQMMKFHWPEPVFLPQQCLFNYSPQARAAKRQPATTSHLHNPVQTIPVQCLVSLFSHYIKSTKLLLIGPLSRSQKFYILLSWLKFTTFVGINPLCIEVLYLHTKPKHPMKMHTTCKVKIDFK